MLGRLPLPSDTPIRRTRDHGFQTGRSIVVLAVGGEGGHNTVDLVEQGADFGTVVRLLGGERNRDDLPGVGV